MRFKHTHTGQHYILTMMTTNFGTGLVVVVFIKEVDNTIWTLPASEFFDGRFLVDHEAPPVPAQERLN